MTNPLASVLSMTSYVFCFDHD